MIVRFSYSLLIALRSVLLI